MNLFSAQSASQAPLADRLRPQTLEEFVGQEQLVGPGAVLSGALRRDKLPSMIFWGPPGSGKTTLAHIIAQTTQAKFVQLSAVSSGKADLQRVLEQAQKDLEFYHKKTILFVDEIHRWNKAQQDALLPAVEKGVVIFIGATTENPSFEVNSALLSRCQVFVLKALDEKQLVEILKRGAAALKIKVDIELLTFITAFSNGDARQALNILEFAASSGKKISKQSIKDSLQKTLVYDKQAEQHYNLISALHKTMRASDPDAALYWLARMLTAGEDPIYIARRVVRFASEDVGNAAPTGLVLAMAAQQACHLLGMPECNLALAQAVEYLAKAPKSRKLDDAWAAIQADIQNYPNQEVPMHLRNAPTKLMKDLGYGKRQQSSNLPANLQDKKYLS